MISADVKADVKQEIKEIAKLQNWLFMKILANNLTLTVLKKFLVLCNARNLYSANQHIFSMCALKVDGHLLLPLAN